MSPVDPVAPDGHGQTPRRMAPTSMSDEPSEPSGPAAFRHTSAPVYPSPIHHHRRRFNPKRQVKETLDARSEYSNSQDDGTAEHRINQYLIKQEIGRGSFGFVHLAVDQFGNEFAVKEFSKTRLRKRIKSNMLRRNNVLADHIRGHFASNRGFNLPLAREMTSPTGEYQNSLNLIRQEIAIMKKLNHPNVVSLIEVLDDPSEDLLYMVLEMCKKGVVMKVGLGERADPYDMERCRLWFRDMILGVEYLHAQGIIHRDIKPDNCLITNDDVLKIVDFGVSEMFSKDSDMATTKSVGSPAFMPPELCVPKHGEVSGRACDIWSMGVTLYCLAFGCIPFEKAAVLDLYESIKSDEVKIPDHCNPDLRDLLGKLLEKDPLRRIEMDDLREHPWVTAGGTDELLPKEENVMNLIELPTDDEVRRAITAPILRMVNVMKAVGKFKRLLSKNWPPYFHSILGPATFVQPPEEIGNGLYRPQSETLADREPVEGNLATRGILREIVVSDDLKAVGRGDVGLSHSPTRYDAKSRPAKLSIAGSGPASPRSETGRGQAHDPLEDTLFLSIGTSSDAPAPEPGDAPMVSESPGVVDVNVYENAYEEEIRRILAAKSTGRKPTLYLTKQVEDIAHLRDHEDITNFDRVRRKAPKTGLGTIAELARLKQ